MRSVCGGPSVVAAFLGTAMFGRWLPVDVFIIIKITIQYIKKIDYLIIMKKTDLSLLLAVLMSPRIELASWASANVGDRKTGAQTRAGGSPRQQQSIRRSRRQAARAAAKRLEDVGLVEYADGALTLRKGVVALLLKRASEIYNLMPILWGSNERVFCSLAEPGTVTDVVERTGLSVPTIYRALRNMYSVGAAQNRSGTISLDDSLVDLAKAMRAVSGRADAHAHVIYEDSKRMLVHVPAGMAWNGELTAFSRFREFGVEYGGVRDYYIDQDGRVGIHDILVHALLAAAERDDIGAMSMVLVFYIKHRDKLDPARIRRTASWFGAASVWLDAESYVRHRAPVRNHKMFPPWVEFVEKADLYDVDPGEYGMPPPAERLLADLGARLERPVDVYLLGGENMRLKGLKESTKDCDILVKDAADFKSVTSALADMGYSGTTHTEHAEDLRLSPSGILKHQTLPRVDIFTDTVMGGITLTEPMADSADRTKLGNLTVGVLRNEHVFLLKAVAAREGDMQDMAVLVRADSGQPEQYDHGEFDWGMVLDETISQDENSIAEASISLLNGLSYLNDLVNIQSPIFDTVKRLAVDAHIMRLARGGWRRIAFIADKLAGGDISRGYVANRARSLVKRGNLRKQTVDRLAFVCGNARFPRPDWGVDKRSMRRYMEWRFHLRDQPGPRTMSEIIQYVRERGYHTLGDLDEAVTPGVFQMPPDPTLTVVEIVRMCIERPLDVEANSGTPAA